MWLQTRLCGCLYKKNKPYFTKNRAYTVIGTRIGLRVTVAIETKSQVQCTLRFLFLKGLLLDYICPVTIKIKTKSNPHCDFCGNHRNKSRIQCTLCFFL